MLPPATWDGLFWLLGGAGMVAGVSLALWALAWDRARGRRRCPRCWYDMRGVPGLTCPECGRECRSERSLRRTRKRWRWAAAGLLLVAASTFTARSPDLRRHGWPAAIPSVVLAVIAPIDPPSVARPATVVGPAWSAYLASPGGTPLSAPATPPTTGERLNEEVWRRFLHGRLGAIGSRVFFRRCLQASGIEPLWTIEFPPLLPIGDPVRAGLKYASVAQPLLSQLTATVAMDRGAPVPLRRSPTQTVELTTTDGTRAHTLYVTLSAGGQVVHRTTRRVTTRFVPGRTDVMSAVSDPVLAEWAASGLETQVFEDHRGVLRLELHRLVPPAPRSADDWLIARVEVLAAGEPIGKSTRWTNLPLVSVKEPQVLAIDWSPCARERIVAAGADLRVRLIGDVATAADLYLASPFGVSSSCWSGSTTIPARWSGPRAAPPPPPPPPASTGGSGAIRLEGTATIRQERHR